MTLAAKLLIGSKKDGKNDGTDLLYHRAKFGTNCTMHFGDATKCDVFTFFLSCLSRSAG